MYLSSYHAFLAAKPDRLHHQTTLSFWFMERHSGHYRRYGNPGASIHGQHWGAVSLPPLTPFCFPLSSPLPPSLMPFFPSEWGIAPIGPLNPLLLIIDWLACTWLSASPNCYCPANSKQTKALAPGVTRNQWFGYTLLGLVLSQFALAVSTSL
jgi:hypothetical protein